MAEGNLIRVRNTELSAQARAGGQRLRLRIEVAHVEARKAHAEIGQEARTEDMGQSQHSIRVGEVRIPWGDAGVAVVEIQRNR